jgi:Na+-translocating ferredoxin:NAD+ oxidoreductase subunit B
MRIDLFRRYFSVRSAAKMWLCIACDNVSHMLSVLSHISVDMLDALLPQTQCQRCSYADCRAYASAMHAGEAEINRCPPGGDATRLALAALLTRDAYAMPALANDVDAYAPEHVAFIDEANCIGCAKCLPACPTDTIIGAAKRMHTIIAEDCTGCELCIIACPVDCITLEPVTTRANAAHATLDAREAQASALRNAYSAHKIRFAERAEDGLSAALASGTTSIAKPVADKRALLADIMARAAAKAASKSA